ncbi:hypothetical protein LTR64_004792 [Lithohypha guttulata]|uniref:uncharacterized protein n=1 Tax=Lithohypha guttulata TaxID=1690604 RepID=UPI002DDDE8FD|nr:hypothetical protein LTR51_005375 [Lithohypha guttulata]
MSTIDSGHTLSLLDLSDEILLLIVSQLDRHDDVLQARLACRKIKDLCETYMYRNVMLTLPEEVTEKWSTKLQTMPPSILLTKHLTILNQNRKPSGFFYDNTIARPNSYRIFRWNLLEEAAHDSNKEFAQAAFFNGVKFFWHIRLPQDQLVSFIWRHATTLSLQMVQDILLKHAKSLERMEVSMISPPMAPTVSEFAAAITKKSFPKFRALTYNGLSHTEPIELNNPEAGGRFRMIRPLFRKVYNTLKELTLSQDHCISQVGKTPLINGREYPNDFLCTLNELYTHPKHDPCDSSRPAVCLNLEKLELGGFNIASLFDVPTNITASPRVRVSLSHLRRLILNDCHNSEALLREMTSRYKEINLTEFGFRYTEAEGDMDGETIPKELSAALAVFLQSFQGLEILSLLWHSEVPIDRIATAISRAAMHHVATLEVYTLALRQSRENNEDGPYLRFSTELYAPVSWVSTLSASEKPKLREFSMVLPKELSIGGYLCLRSLSQFDELRTVHIRNFPPIQQFPETFPPRTRDGFWRDSRGAVTMEAISAGAIFAEHIALPYYGLLHDNAHHGAEASSKDFAASLQSISDHWGLQKLADQHALRRDQMLLSGARVRPLFRTSVPIGDITPRILEQKAETDYHFADIMRRVKAQSASIEENMYYQEYVVRIRTVLGYDKPSDDDKPKLRLLVVGEWRYRDQMNLTGPRTWDPEAWSLSESTRSRVTEASVDEDDDDEDDLGDLDDSEDEMDNLRRERRVPLRLRSGFKKEFDVCLLPIFFKVDWHAEKDKKDKKWRWKAKLTVLEQSTLEGYTTLGDVKGLDFAWQN